MTATTTRKECDIPSSAAATQTLGGTISAPNTSTLTMVSKVKKRYKGALCEIGPVVLNKQNF